MGDVNAGGISKLLQAEQEAQEIVNKARKGAQQLAKKAYWTFWPVGRAVRASRAGERRCTHAALPQPTRRGLPAGRAAACVARAAGQRCRATGFRVHARSA
jgi:hypothetical protein